jgi:D-3-phosphoglycerate dehydrogenase / 2-oxoglutarate reductase
MKALFIDSVHPVLEERLSKAGYTCVHDYTSSYVDLLKKISEFDGLVIRSRVKIDRSFLDSASSLKWIARSGSGMENIDIEYALRRGIRCINSPEGNADAVAEHVIGMILMLLNKLNTANEEVKTGLWRREENRGIEITGKVFSIIGYGVMGSTLVKKLSGFGCEILAHDKYKTGFSNEYVKEVTLEEVFERSDFVSLHLPLNEETTYYANEVFFKSFQKEIYFVNASRGKNTDTEALLNAINSQLVLGACIDVLEYEKASLEGLESSELPKPLKGLIDSKRVVFSPHVAGWTVESYFKLSNILADKILL